MITKIIFPIVFIYHLLQNKLNNIIWKNPNRKIEILAYKVESFDSDSFKEDLFSYSADTLLLMFNQKGIYFESIPQNAELKNKHLSFLRFNPPKLNYFLYPIVFFFDHFRIFLLFLSICLQYRVKVIVVENTYVAVIAGIMRKLGLSKKVIYLPGDWLAGKKAIPVSLSYIGSNLVFPFFDYWACRWSDKVANGTQAMMEARNKFWGKTIAKREIIFHPILKSKKKITDSSNREKKLVFIGNIRKDSGLELVIKSLNTIRKNLDVTLKIIGPYSDLQKSLKKLAEKYQVENYIEFTGFKERKNFGDAFSDCFCGLSIITDRDSYTTKTLPAKTFDYLQYLLPVIATKNIGITAEIIQSYKLGVIIKPTEDSFVNAVMKVYEECLQYQKNIVLFIASRTKTDFEELLKC